jgi:hypothetical protein
VNDEDDDDSDGDDDDAHDGDAKYTAHLRYNYLSTNIYLPIWISTVGRSCITKILVLILTSW